MKIGTFNINDMSGMTIETLMAFPCQINVGFAKLLK